MAAMIGKNVAVVARLLVNSVKKMTKAVALITNAEIPNIDMGDKLSPNHCANPLLAIVAAKLKPPPNKIRTPHGKRSRLDHVINCGCCLSPLGMKNRRRAPKSAMAVSDNP